MKLQFPKLLMLLMVMSGTLFFQSCGSSGTSEDKNENETRDNQLTKEETKAGWKLLFDGKTTAGWRNFNSDTLVGWEVDSGMLIALGQGGDHANDIITLDQYDDFELKLDWKISPGANSGIFFNAQENDVKAIYEIAPEYQIIDDNGWPGELEEWQKTGANYAMHLPNEKKTLNPVGEFNSSSIVVKDSLVQHFLNGNKILEYTMYSDEWDSLRNSGKWDEFPKYGTTEKGHIGLQDHGNKVFFKNIKIREL